ncbi:uncharacterized protein [Cherax quadricarinatus]|uniref:uncharacterized protein isoform X2 n=1 Tax=Cherax quadricarinatus TaxID=27406 RepID=UPI002378FD64|nr:uncharacterized protein LOC128689980 isoform X2 [Cherax quadricarinatus]
MAVALLLHIMGCLALVKGQVISTYEVHPAIVVPTQPTSTLTVQVVFVTATVGANPVSTMVSIFSQFVTVTDTIKYWQTITHVDVTHQIHTVPVVTTQDLLQQIITTITQIVTTTVTSTTARYYG